MYIKKTFLLGLRVKNVRNTKQIMQIYNDKIKKNKVFKNFLIGTHLMYKK